MTLSTSQQKPSKHNLLADFIADLTPSKANITSIPWKLQIDGLVSRMECEVGIILVGLHQERIEHVGHLTFHAMNNEAKYVVLLIGLSLAKELGIKKIEILTDSQLVARQTQGEYISKKLRVTPYGHQPKLHQWKWRKASITLISKANNEQADAMARFATTPYPPEG